MANKPTCEESEKEVRKSVKKNIEGDRVEKALRESGERYRDLYESAPNAYFSIRAIDGSVVSCNAKALQLLGYDREAIMRMKVFDLYANTPHGLPRAG